jgi:leader peptidase (prepilin peptidase)/N-methyltransferase
VRSVVGAPRIGFGAALAAIFRGLKRLSGERPAAAVFALGCSLALASFAASPDLEGLLGAVLSALMLAIAVSDYRAFIIPDRLSSAAFIVGLAHAAAADPLAPLEGVWTALLRGVIVAGALFLFRVVYFRLRGREGIGLGDVKLAGVAGVWLDLSMVTAAIEIAALAALGTYALQQRRRARALRAKAMLPFGLFFAPAIWLCWLFERFWTAVAFIA